MVCQYICYFFCVQVVWIGDGQVGELFECYFFGVIGFVDDVDGVVRNLEGFMDEVGGNCIVFWDDFFDS